MSTLTGRHAASQQHYALNYGLPDMKAESLHDVACAHAGMYNMFVTLCPLHKLLARACVHVHRQGTQTYMHMCPPPAPINALRYKCTCVYTPVCPIYVLRCVRVYIYIYVASSSCFCLGLFARLIDYGQPGAHSLETDHVPAASIVPSD